MKRDKQIAKISDWIQSHEKALKELYEDFLKESKDDKINFVEFACFMYDNCKH